MGKKLFNKEKMKKIFWLVVLGIWRALTVLMNAGATPVSISLEKEKEIKAKLSVLSIPFIENKAGLYLLQMMA